MSLCFTRHIGGEGARELNTSPMSSRIASRTVFIQTAGHILACIVALYVVPATAQKSLANSPSQASPAQGPLRVHPTNPRYFTDGSGKAIYLTGSHTWNNFQDGGWAADGVGQNWTNYLKRFDYSGYLKFLRDYGHNFIRLWTPENAADLGTNRNLIDPVAYLRPGPGQALDGQPKFDLTRLNSAYFARLRERVIAARDSGIYVSIMLFDVWGLGQYNNLDSWKGHPFHASNNINGINGDPNGDGKGLECNSLEMPAVTAVQDAYVRRVIDTVNDLHNVLYEINNEGAPESKDWQLRLIDLIKGYEAGKPKQHPVGLTEFGVASNDLLLASRADWISPATMDPLPGQDYVNDPPAATGAKVILSDTDHLSNNIQTPNRATHVWIWKSFLRGLNPIYMDQLPELGGPVCCGISPFAEDVRQAMGATHRFAQKMNLAALAPCPKLTSTEYCLANPGTEYLVYQPKGGESFSVELTSSLYHYEWFNPASGQGSGAGDVKAAGGRHSFKAPFPDDAVLYLQRTKPKD